MRATPNCYKRGCVHLLGILQKDGEEKGEVPNCLAFPAGIPDEIAYGDNLHLHKFKGQAGDFVYEKKEVK